jgi:hypothetical protein
MENILIVQQRISYCCHARLSLKVLSALCRATSKARTHREQCHYCCIFFGKCLLSRCLANGYTRHKKYMENGGVSLCRNIEQGPRSSQTRSFYSVPFPFSPQSLNLKYWKNGNTNLDRISDYNFSNMRQWHINPDTKTYTFLTQNCIKFEML